MAFSEEIKTKVMVLCGRRCCVCHKFCGNNMEVHHIKAHADGGDDTLENAIPLCFDCHAIVRQYDPKHPKGVRFSEKELVQHRDAWYEHIKQGGSTINPSFLAIPVITSVNNELCGYFDSKGVEKRLLEFQRMIEEQSITIENLKNRINVLDEHSQYVFRNNVKHLCVSALPETTETLINCLISYLMNANQDMDEEICEIVCSCNANDIRLLQMIRQYIEEGQRIHYYEMLEKLKDDINDRHTKQEPNEDVKRKTYSPKKWYDRNVIYGENTVFWKDFTQFFHLKNANDMGVVLNTFGESGEGKETYIWASLVRSMLKFQSKGVIQMEFITSLGTISQNNIDRFHITLFGQKLLEYISKSD